MNYKWQKRLGQGYGVGEEVGGEGEMRGRRVAIETIYRYVFLICVSMNVWKLGEIRVFRKISRKSETMNSKDYWKGIHRFMLTSMWNSYVCKLLEQVCGRNKGNSKTCKQRGGGEEQ